MALEKIRHYAIPCGCATPTDPGANMIPKAWEPRFDELTASEAFLLRSDVTGRYTPQGACFGGGYLYRALVAEDTEPTMIQKINPATGEIVKERTLDVLGHANDLTYVKGEVYVAHSASTSTIYALDGETLELKRTFSVPSTIWGIEYEPENDLFILGTVGSAYLSVYYPDFSFMYRIKPQNPFYGFVRQGIAADKNYIYVALDNAYGAVIGNNMGSSVMVYTWNGIWVKTLHVAIKEIEFAVPYNGTMYVGTYEGRDASDVKSGNIFAIPFDLYPEQTVITGRPTDVSGSLNNLHRLPEGTPVRLWVGSEKGSGTVITLRSKDHGLTVDEDGPFRFLRFRFKGANDNVFDWYPENNGVVTLREFDVTAAANDSTIRFREARLIFNHGTQTFVLDSNLIEELKKTASTNTTTITKSPAVDPIEVFQIWGVV